MLYKRYLSVAVYEPGYDILLNQHYYEIKGLDLEGIIVYWSSRFHDSHVRMNLRGSPSCTFGNLAISLVHDANHMLLVGVVSARGGASCADRPATTATCAESIS